MLPEISMQWRKENTFFICYSYNQMTYFISGNLVGKMQLLSWKLFFVCAVWSRQCWESTGVSEGNWEHLLPYSWLFLGCTWAGGCSSQVCSGVFGDPSWLQGTDWLQPGTVLCRSRKESFSVRGGWSWLYFPVWLDQRLAEWCQKLSCFGKWVK